jgi:hypothetical protein
MRPGFKKHWFSYVAFGMIPGTTLLAIGLFIATFIPSMQRTPFPWYLIIIFRTGAVLFILYSIGMYVFNRHCRAYLNRTSSHLYSYFRRFITKLKLPKRKLRTFSHMVTIKNVTIHYHFDCKTDKEADEQIAYVNERLRTMINADPNANIMKFEKPLGIRIQNIDAPYVRNYENPEKGIWG